MTDNNHEKPETFNNNINDNHNTETSQIKIENLNENSLEAQIDINIEDPSPIPDLNQQSTHSLIINNNPLSQVSPSEHSLHPHQNEKSTCISVDNVGHQSQTHTSVANGATIIHSVTTSGGAANTAATGSTAASAVGALGITTTASNSNILRPASKRKIHQSGPPTTGIPSMINHNSSNLVNHEHPEMDRNSLLLQLAQKENLNQNHDSHPGGANEESQSHTQYNNFNNMSRTNNLIQALSAENISKGLGGFQKFEP